jgi:phosphoesterase RecJ-like protein
MKDINSGSIENLERLISDSGRICIVTHMKPDGDAIGSSMGMYHVLKEIYSSNPKVAIANPAPAYLDFLLAEDVTDDVLIYECKPEDTERTILESDLGL